MKRRRWSFARVLCCAELSVAVAGTPASSPPDPPDPPDPPVAALVAQLEGGACAYASDRPCAPRHLVDRVFGLLFGHAGPSCVQGAAICLGRMGPRAAEALPALLRVLRDGPADYDTGDGVITARSAVAAALAAIGDERAIDPLAEALRTAGPMDRGPGALASSEPASRHALLAALASFGPAAGRHWELAAAVLRERQADERGYRARRADYERSAAMAAAAETIREQNPGVTTFVIPEAAIAAALAELDRSDPDFLGKCEFAAVDQLAAAACRALAAFGRTEAIPLLIETLANPAVAQASADALARFGQAAAPAVPELERLVLASAAHGPHARAAAVRALGATGDDRAIAPLVRALGEPALREPAAKALAPFGKRARVALPALRAMVALPTNVVRSADGGLHYDIQATRVLGAKLAAVRAIAAIDPAGAAATLASYARDDEIGAVVRRVLKPPGTRTGRPR